MKNPRVLVACERNQFITIAFRQRGIEAYSNDIQPCTGGFTEWHLQCDALQLMKLPWDLVIAHPPCTYLTAAGAVRLFDSEHRVKDYERYMAGLEAASFFREFLNSWQKRVVIADVMHIETPRFIAEIDWKEVPEKVFGLVAEHMKELPRMDDGFDLEEVSPARFEKCEECGKKSVVKDYIVRRKNKNAVR